LELPGKANGRTEGSETGGLGDDARDQIVDVPAWDGDLYRSAEYVAEQQSEHDRLYDGKKDVRGYTPPNEQISLCHDKRIFDDPASPLRTSGIG
jgi:hypothetical protein